MHRREFHARTEDQEVSTNPWLDGRQTPVNTRGFDKLDSESSHRLPLLLSRTAVGHKRYQSSPGHPLRPSLSVSSNSDEASGFGTSLDLHETRPSLRRAIKARTESLEGGNETSSECGSHKDAGDTRKKEAEVIVHYICPGDSLPGVALKYNISLAALRNANKLWANDTIHLRERLYIPIRTISSSTASSSARSSLDGVVEERTDTRHSTGMDVGKTRMRHTISSTAPKIRRVPISELSFFPPSSTPPPISSNPSRPAVSRSFSNQQTLPSPPSAFSRNTSTLGLANIWHSAKDEIMSRLSLDSAWPSSEGGDEPEFELGVVNGVKRSDKNDTKIRTPSFGSALGVDAIPLEEPPRKRQVIRTQQLQPSAAMIIPVSPKV